MISVLILTKNEAAVLGGCLETLTWCDDVHVFDSYSTDNTVDMAVRAGARVAQRVFDGYASQRNAALRELPFKYPWVLSLDADERLPRVTSEALLRFVQSSPEGVVAVRLQRRDFLFDKWLKHSSMSPFNIRLFRPDRVRVERQINEVLLVDGKTVDLPYYFEHFPFAKGIAFWVERHNRYSTMEAQRALQERKERIRFSLKTALLHEDRNVRRYHQKGLFYRMRWRPVIKWGYQVFWRRAFLDGSAGIIYATLQAFYEFLIVVKEREIASTRNCPGGGRRN